MIRLNFRESPHTRSQHIEATREAATARGWLLCRKSDRAQEKPRRSGAKRQASERMNNARDSANRPQQRTIINGKM